jgi:hypothetical protein
MRKTYVELLKLIIFCVIIEVAQNRRCVAYPPDLIRINTVPLGTKKFESSVSVQITVEDVRRQSG